MSPIWQSHSAHSSAFSGVSPFSTSRLRSSSRDIGRAFMILSALALERASVHAETSSLYASSSKSIPEWIKRSVIMPSVVLSSVPSSKTSVKRSGEVCFISRRITSYQPSKSSAETSTARPAAWAALRACGLMSLYAFSRICCSIFAQTSGLQSRYSLTASRP